MNYWDDKKLRQEERAASSAWYRKGKTYRANSLEALKVLYSSGVQATLESQPATPWEDGVDLRTAKEMKPGHPPNGILTRKGERGERGESDAKRCLQQEESEG